ncbi:MAG: hypothetical protein ABIX01_21845 [Chitinophagaceae bacterium]
MNVKVFLNLLLMVCLASVQGKAQPGFNRSAFYSVLATGTASDIETQLNVVNGSAITEKEAYTGTLLMKKAELVAKAKDKLKFFKSGRSKLEASILKDIENTEYRFLRLIIQEHAPKVVKYRGEVAEDSQLIRSNFKSLSPSLQEVIIDYSKKSKVLKNL